jgi:hypothetical protein
MEASGRGAALASPAATDTTTKTAAVPDLDFILENGEMHQSRSIKISIARNNWGWAASSPALYQSINCWGSSLLPWCHTRRDIDHPHQSIHLLIDYPDPDPCWTRAFGTFAEP